MDNQEFILDLPVRFKCVWHSGSAWPIFVAVLLVFDRLLLWRPIYVEHINQSPLQYSTDHPAGLQGPWITNNVLAVISLLPRTWDTVKLNLNRHMWRHWICGDISSRFFNPRIGTRGLWSVLMWNCFLIRYCLSLKIPCSGESLFFNLGISPFEWSKHVRYEHYWLPLPITLFLGQDCSSGHWKPQESMFDIVYCVTAPALAMVSSASSSHDFLFSYSFAWSIYTQAAKLKSKKGV